MPGAVTCLALAHEIQHVSKAVGMTVARCHLDVFAK